MGWDPDQRWLDEARLKYQEDCVLVESYEVQAAQEQSEEMSQKLKAARFAVQVREKSYRGATQVLAEHHKRWKSEWKLFCDVSSHWSVVYPIEP